MSKIQDQFSDAAARLRRVFNDDSELSDEPVNIGREYALSKATLGSYISAPANIATTS